MESTISALAVIGVLSAWHLLNRRHPGWRASPEGRFFVLAGYPLVVIAVYWMASARTGTAWEWALGNAWALAAMLSFVYGFEALNRVTAEHAWRSQIAETIEPSTGSIPRQT
ncbi:hypothetical protein Mycch_1331 [Mycolicibacterium chubuense NBB4]|uniref:Uncharacterized protein n=1 Tax=Mycolicibacterium chubuense (strain NBB4) TaxID=710421 RepID=I4BFS6_MYCCN|nr:hypothetical protein [Mycolicibacterium chubuense]AFM16133.1 hypothetical protein Mycch_1331 [Mycolicibacterium chubuense NBB4]